MVCSFLNVFIIIYFFAFRGILKFDNSMTVNTTTHIIRQQKLYKNDNDEQ